MALGVFTAERLPAELTKRAPEHSPSDIRPRTNEGSRLLFQRWPTRRDAIVAGRCNSCRRLERAVGKTRRRLHLISVLCLHSLPPCAARHPRDTLHICRCAHCNRCHLHQCTGSVWIARKQRSSSRGIISSACRGSQPVAQISPWPNACTAATLRCCCVEP